MTAPFAPRVAELITGALRHETVVQVVPAQGDTFLLDVDRSLSVTFSEDWSPYVQADVEAVIPAVDALDRMDPRLNCRLKISAGYTYPDNITEIFPLADLGIRARPVSRPAGTVGLDAGSDEYRAQDYRATFWPGLERAGVNEAIGFLAGYAVFPETPRLVSDVPARTGAAALAELEVNLGDDYWSIMEDVASRTGKRIWCDEFRTWRVGERPERTGTVAHELTVGESGTIVSSSAGLSREEWANSVCLEYSWTTAAGEDRLIYGRAQASSGDYIPAKVGHKVHFERITRPVNQAAADRAAAAKLRNLITRGRSLTLEAAAAYWLRPGMTVRVTLPTGSPELHLIQSITFTPLTGLMRLTTRQPLNVTITNGE